MAFNADEYISVIVEQIGANFTELHEAVGNCDEFQKIQKEYLEFDMDNGDVEKFVELHDKFSLQKKSVSNLVCNYDIYKTIEPLSVGLFGEWGSGKTHLLKLIEQQVIHLQYEKKVFPQTTIPVFFNAWRFEKEEHLIVPLFQTLLASIESFDSKHLDKNIQKQLGRTKERLKILSFALAKGFQIPKNINTTVATLMSGDLTAVADFIDTEKVAKAVKEGEKKAFVTAENLTELLNSDRIESIYMNIPQWIEKITIVDNINFVFLIDDLDRCLPENTLKMLESIKLFLDVPSCAFVLAIDDDVVERGVEHHYKDYLKDMVRHELPITGHEYLEKMIQLPFRIPVIGTDNVYDFLDERYRSTFEKILHDNGLRKKESLKEQESQTDMILKFFSKTIPPKPRKIKRTIMLFETKVHLLRKLKLPLQPKLIAKITLLELFAPKLLRFMQNNDYERIYNRLVFFADLMKLNPNTREKLMFSLADIEEINIYIESGIDYTTKEKDLFLNLIKIVEEMKNSRMNFNLDMIFDKIETKEDLKLNIEISNFSKKKQYQKHTNFSGTSLNKLFRIDDVASWGDAFQDNEIISQGNALLSKLELTKIIEIAKERKNSGFLKNPEWMGIVSEYITDDEYIRFLKDIYKYRFIEVKETPKIAVYNKKECSFLMKKSTKYQFKSYKSFYLGEYLVTFSEYERYCKIKNIDVPNDNGWGRGSQPILNISWHDATKYVQWLSEVLGHKYRLPTEDEWYFSCNNNLNTKWHFGNDVNSLLDYAWFCENSENHTHPVGRKSPNCFGLYDMHGNVWEWCSDWFDSTKEKKVLRGGSSRNKSDELQSVNRLAWSPTAKSDFFGFRILRE